MNQWLDWGRADAEQLARTDSVFARLDATARAAAAPLAGHPAWPALREAMRGRVHASAEHQAALDRLTAAMHAKPRCG